jgi:hypothetical protein
MIFRTFSVFILLTMFSEQVFIEAFCSGAAGVWSLSFEVLVSKDFEMRIISEGSAVCSRVLSLLVWSCRGFLICVDTYLKWASLSLSLSSI